MPISDEEYAAHLAVSQQSDMGNDVNQTFPKPEPAVHVTDEEYAEKLKGVSSSAPETSTVGSAFHHAIGGIAPATAGFAGFEGGFALGAPLAPFTFGAAPIITGLAGAIGAGMLAEKAQEAVVAELPYSIQHALGQTPEQRQQEEAEHPWASFAGGMLPMLVGSVGGVEGALARAPTATALERLMGNPIIARGIGGGFQGGFEAGQEYITEDNIDWTKVAIAGAMGTVMGRPNALGNAFGNLGRLPAQKVTQALGYKVAEIPHLDPNLPDPNKTPAEVEIKNRLETVNSEIDTAINGEIVTKTPANSLNTAVAGGLLHTSDNVVNDITPMTKAQADTQITAAMGIKETELTIPPLRVEDYMREADPQLMNRADTISATYDTLQGHVRELQDKHDAEIHAQIDNIYNPELGLEERLSRENKDKLASLRAQLGQETPEIRAVGQRALDALGELFDMHPQLDDLRKNAQLRMDKDGRIGELVGAGEVKENIAPETLVPEISATVAQPEVLNIRDSIANDLVRTGRISEEVATETANATAAHYSAWGKLTGLSAEELREKLGATKITGNGKTGSQFSDELFQKKVGSYSREGNTIKILKNANPSTALHELSHRFLDELVDINRWENCPPELKSLMSDTFSWLGINDIDHFDALKGRDREIKHEKFAESLINYTFQKGVVPSPEMQNTFTRFREWLASLVGTIKGLGEKLSPGVERIMDRFILGEPGMAAYSPKPRVPLADVHTAIAKVTEPRLAHAEAIRIQNEGALQAARDGVDLNAVNKGIEQESFPDTTEVNQPEHNATAGADSKSNVGGEKISAEHAGGSEPKAEGTGLPNSHGGAGEREIKSDRAGNKPEPSAAAPTGKGGSIADDASTLHKASADGPGLAVEAPFTKNGDGTVKSENGHLNKINVEKYRFSDYVENLVKIVVTSDPEFNLIRNTNMTGAAQDAIIVKRLQPLIREAGIQTYNAMTEVMEKFKSDTLNEGELGAAMQKYENLRNALINLNRKYLPYTTAWSELGRSLQPSKQNIDFMTTKDFNSALKTVTGKSPDELYQMMMLAKDSDNPLQMLRQISTDTRNFMEKGKGAFIYFYINNLLSGLFTHVAYTVSHQVLMPFNALVSATSQIALNQLRGREGEAKMYWGEIGAQMKGYESLGRAMNAAWRAAKLGTPELVAGEVGFDPETHGKMMFSEPLPNPITDLLNGPLGSKAATIIGNVLGLPVHSISGIHTFNKFMAYSMELNRQVFRAAAQDAEANRALGGRMDVNERFNQIMNNEILDPDMMIRFKKIQESAAIFGNKMALNERAPWDSITRKISNITANNVFAKVMIPFSQVEMNIVQQGIMEHTPVGLFQARTRNKFTGMEAKENALVEIIKQQYGENKNAALASGGEYKTLDEAKEEILKNLTPEQMKIADAAGYLQSDLTAGKMLAGTFLMGGAMAMAANGGLTGAAANEQQRREWALIGKQENSIKVGNEWFAFPKWMSYLAKPMMMAADLYQLSKHLDKNTFEESTKELGHYFADFAVNGTWMDSLGEIYRGANNPNTTGEEVAKNVAMGLLPYSTFLNQFARMQEFDPFARRITTWKEALMNRIPGESQEILPKYDILGKEIPNHMALMPRTESDDMIRNGLVRMGYVPTMPKKEIHGIPLDEDQYAELARLSGLRANANLIIRMNDPSWGQYNFIQQKMIAKSIFRNARMAAENTIVLKSQNGPNDIMKLFAAKTQAAKQAALLAESLPGGMSE